jgi:hypothetical protein
VLATFEHCGRQREKTAATLGVGMKTLYNRLKNTARPSAPLPAHMHRLSRKNYFICSAICRAIAKWCSTTGAVFTANAFRSGSLASR